MRLLNTYKSLRVVVAVAIMLSMGVIAQASAQQATSTNYSVDETNFSSGSQRGMCTATYCADGTAGDLTVGSGSSTNYSAQFGSDTTNQPLLEVIVDQASADMGVITTSNTGKVSASVSVRNYLSNGYTLQITGRTPNNSGRYITPMGTADFSSQGTEQFGINLVDNATPDIGANPVQVPDGGFSFGTVNSYYSVADKFKYVEGDVVASSLTSSGQTNYTVSMIMNIADSTPGGRYSGQFSAVVAPTY